jgi:hypothetical protein
MVNLIVKMEKGNETGQGPYPHMAQSGPDGHVPWPVLFQAGGAQFRLLLVLLVSVGIHGVYIK